MHDLWDDIEDWVHPSNWGQGDHEDYHDDHHDFDEGGDFNYEDIAEKHHDDWYGEDGMLDEDWGEDGDDWKKKKERKLSETNKSV